MVTFLKNTHLKFLFLILLALPLLAQSASISDFNPRAYYSCDETSGTRYDSTIFDNDLTDNNTVLYATGLLGNACDFERSNSEYLSISDASQTGLDITGNITLCLRYKPESLPTNSAGQYYHQLINKYAASGNRSYNLSYQDEGTKQFAFYTSTNGTALNAFATYSYTLTTGTWYAICATYNTSNGNVKWYRDGTLVETDTTNTGAIYNSGAALAVGAYSTGANYVDGLFDDVMIVNSELSSSSILTWYNSGTPLTYEQQPASSTSQYLPIPYNSDMPQLETIVCETATCTLNYATSTLFYPTPANLFFIFLFGVLSLSGMAFLAYRFL